MGGWNVEGLRSHRSDKLAYLGQWLCDCGADIVGLSETWWAEGDAAAPRGYKVLAGAVVRLSPESLLARRGVALVYRENLQVTPLPDNSADAPFLLGARLQMRSGRPLHIAVLYADGSDARAADREFARLRVWVSKYSKLGDVVVVGDFNLRQNAQRLAALLLASGLVDAGAGGLPTTKKDSRLDLTLASPGLVVSHRVDRSSPAAVAVDSFHFPTLAELSWCVSEGRRPEPLLPPLRTPFRWKEADSSCQQRFVEAVQAGLAALPASIEAEVEAWQQAIGQVLHDAAVEVVGVRPPVREHAERHPSRAVEQLCSMANRLLKEAARTRRRGLDATEERTSGRRFRTMAKILARTQEDQRLESLAALMAKDGTRSMWAYVSAATRQPSQLPSEVLDSSGAVTTGEARLGVLRDFWAKVTNPDTEPTSEQQRAWMEEIHRKFGDAAAGAPVDEAHELSAPLEEAEVAAAIRALDVRKAGGPDGTQSFMLKWAAEVLVPPLTRLFNRCWCTSQVPQAWRDAWVSLIYKGGSRAEPGDYRPISLLALLGRMLSFVVNKRLTAMLESRGLLVDNQFGFRRNRGCPEAVFALRELGELRRLDLKPTWLCFVDVAKAYDTVWREALFVKLFDLVGKCRLWSLLVSWYSNDRSRIAAEGRTSSWWSNGAGVKQGDVCSPILYSVFINDVVSEFRLRHLGVRVSDRLPLLPALLYADDQALLADSPEQLQTMMDVLAEYASRWLFRLNPKKSAVMVYGTSHRIHPPRLWWLGGDLVAERSSYRYLGVILQADGGFSEHVLDLLDRGRRRLAAVRHRFLRGGRLPGKLARVLIMANMFGVLEYGAAIWSCDPPHGSADLDVLWKAACRAAVGAPRYVHSAAVLGDLDLHPLHIRRALHVASLYFKVAAAPPGSIVAEIFGARRRQFLGGAALPLSHTWLQQVGEALQLLGLSEHFLQLEEQNLINGPLKRGVWRAKMLLGARAAMQSWWRSEVVRHSPFMDLLERTCPNGPRRARYVQSRAGRLKGFLSSLRAGSLPVRQCAPACRYARFDRDAVDDGCRLCGLEEESVLHFLFRCPSLDAVRRLGDPFWSRIPTSLDGVAIVLSGFSGSPHGFHGLTNCWFRMWRFRDDALRVNSETFALRWPGFVRPVLVPAGGAVSLVAPMVGLVSALHA